MGQVEFNKILTREQFNESLESKLYKSYEEYYADQLRKTSIHTLAKNSASSNTSFENKSRADLFRELEIERLDKKNAVSEQLIQKYQEYKKIYLQMLGQQNSVTNRLMSQYNAGSQKELLNTFKEKNIICDRDNYSQSVKTTDEAYARFVAALSTANSWTHSV